MFSIKRNAVAAVTAEFLGAGLLVMVAMILGQTTAVSYFIGTSVAVAAAAVYGMFYVVSGAHANPAVTFGLWTARRIGTLRAIAYIVAQLLGGAAAWQLFQYFTNHTVTARTIPFSTPTWLAEVVGTAVLVMAFTAVLTRKFESLYSVVLIGAAYFVGIVIAATAGSGYINPAVALGSRAWSSTYVLGPLVGGLLGANIYAFLYADTPARMSGTVVRRVTLRRGKK